MSSPSFMEHIMQELIAFVVITFLVLTAYKLGILDEVFKER